MEGKSEESDESEEDGLAKDPDFTGCGARWLDSEDSYQKWEVAHDRVVARDLLPRSEGRAGNLNKALRDWDAGHTGDKAEGCDSGVAVKREGSQIPLPINTMQEPVHPKAVSNDFVNLSKKTPQKLNEARPAEVLCKNKFRRLQRKV